MFSRGGKLYSVSGKTSVVSRLFVELLCVISHCGDVDLGHFVSYQKISGKWFLNDDPLLQLVSGETVEILFLQSS